MLKMEKKEERILQAVNQQKRSSSQPEHLLSASASTPETAFIVESFPVGPLQCNCTIIGDPTSRTALLVDPGGDARQILDRLNAHNLKVRCILHTHAHFDHFLAAGDIQKETGAPIALHRADEPLWLNLEKQCQLFGLPYQPAPPPDQWLEHEQPLALPNLNGICLHTPGHSPGSTSFYFEPLKLLLAGDTLFRGSVGRTDLWGGDFSTLQQAIQTRLYTLDEATRVITGHGPATQIGWELENNGVVTGKR